MKRSKFTEEQIAFALRQFETGNRVEEVCLQMGISEATFFNWKKKFGSLGVSELRRLRQLERRKFPVQESCLRSESGQAAVTGCDKKSCETSEETRTGHVSSGCIPGIGSTCLQCAAIGSSKPVLSLTSS